MITATKMFWLNFFLLCIGVFGAYDEAKIIVGGISMNIWGAAYVIQQAAKRKEGE